MDVDSEQPELLIHTHRDLGGLILRPSGLSLASGRDDTNAQGGVEALGGGQGQLWRRLVRAVEAIAGGGKIRVDRPPITSSALDLPPSGCLC